MTVRSSAWRVVWPGLALGAASSCFVLWFALREGRLPGWAGTLVIVVLPALALSGYALAVHAVKGARGTPVPSSRISPVPLLHAMSVLTLVATLVGSLGSLGWLFDLLSHFRMQYFGVGILMALALGLLREPRGAAVALLVVAINGGLLLPLFVGGHAEPGAGPRIRIYALNVHTGNLDHDAVLGSIDRYDPDVVVAMEVDHAWMRSLASLAETYPYTIADPRVDNFGIALFSKRPFADSRIVRFGEWAIPSALVTLDFDREKVAIFGTHPLPPVNGKYAAARDGHLAGIAKLVHDLDAPVLVVGDLNATRWSAPVRNLLATSGLHDGALGFGWQPTWPAGPLPLQIPIDQTLYTDGITIVDREIGADVGSDHYPVIVTAELGFRRGE